MFKIEAEFTTEDIENWINADLNNWFDDLAEFFLSTGKDLVDKARAKTREEGGFGNITWNLRASIGCAVVRNHTISDGDTYFPPVNNGGEGHKIGIAYLREIASLIDDGDVYLLFVAGMEYASFVQKKGKDVIDHVIGDNIGNALNGIM